MKKTKNLKKRKISEILAEMHNDEVYDTLRSTQMLDTSQDSISVNNYSLLNENEFSISLCDENNPVVNSIENKNIHKTSDVVYEAKELDLNFDQFLKTKGEKRKPKKCKQYFSKKKRQKLRDRNELVKLVRKDAFIIENKARLIGLKYEPYFSKINNNEITKDMKIKIGVKSLEEFSKKSKTCVEKICKAKEYGNVSNMKYNNFAKNSDNTLPSSYKVNKAKQILNNKQPRVYRNKYGSYLDPYIKIKDFITKKFD
jgi:hypothetical protein